MIQIQNLTKTFRNCSTPVVDSISFSVSEGEIVGILGENGAGKTTLLRMIATILKPTSGTAFVNTHNILSSPEKVREQIGMLFSGEAGLYDRLSARENIYYFSDLNGASRVDSEKIIDKMSRVLDMNDFLDKRVSTFSRGMKQKTALARAVIHNPPVMLFDEPTTGLDISSTQTVHDFILTCRELGKSILLSSHNIKELKKVCSRILLLHNGKIHSELDTGEMGDDYYSELETIFLNLIQEKP